MNPDPKHCYLPTYCFCLGTDAAVLLHAKAADSRDGEPEGAEGVPHMRQDPVRQVHLEQTHANTYRYVLVTTRRSNGHEVRFLG